MKATTGLAPLTQPATMPILAQRVPRYQQVPTHILQTQPVSQKAAPGKTIDVLVCGVPVCQQIYQGMVQAGDLLHWTVKKVNLGTSPQDFAAAYTQAVRDKPDLVIGSGLSRALFNKQLLQLKAENVPVLMYAGPDGPGNGITWNMLDAPTYYATAQIIAEEIAYDSKLTGHIVMYNVTQYAGSTALANTLRQYLPEVCPKCSLDYQIEQVSQVANLGSTVSGYVSSHPDTNYVICTFGDLCDGVGQALKAAGQTGVKIVTRDSTTLNYQNIASGTEWATVPLPNGQTGWQVIDAAQRIFNHQSLLGTRLFPQQFVTKITNPSDPLIGAVPDYQAQYKALWQLG
jgi:ribose transport system substrate-binding protein